MPNLLIKVTKVSFAIFIFGAIFITCSLAANFVVSFSMCRFVLITTSVSMSSMCSSRLIAYSFMSTSHCLAL